MVGLAWVRFPIHNYGRIFCRFDTIHERDRQSAIHRTTAYAPRLCIASRGKNTVCRYPESRPHVVRSFGQSILMTDEWQTRMCSNPMADTMCGPPCNLTFLCHLVSELRRRYKLTLWPWRFIFTRSPGWYCFQKRRPWVRASFNKVWFTSDLLHQPKSKMFHNGLSICQFRGWFCCCALHYILVLFAYGDIRAPFSIDYLSPECSAISCRSRPPMTPVFSIIRSFLYMFIFHVVALHPVYHRSTLSPTSSCPFHSAF